MTAIVALAAPASAQEPTWTFPGSWDPRDGSKTLGNGWYLNAARTSFNKSKATPQVSKAVAHCDHCGSAVKKKVSAVTVDPESIAGAALCWTVDGGYGLDYQDVDWAIYVVSFDSEDGTYCDPRASARAELGGELTVTTSLTPRTGTGGIWHEAEAVAEAGMRVTISAGGDSQKAEDANAAVTKTSVTKVGGVSTSWSFFGLSFEVKVTGGWGQKQVKIADASDIAEVEATEVSVTFRAQANTKLRVSQLQAFGYSKVQADSLFACSSKADVMLSSSECGDVELEFVAQ